MAAAAPTTSAASRTKELTNEDHLRRLIYLNNVDPKYISGGEKYVPVSDKKQELVDKFLVESLDSLLYTIITASEDILLPHRHTLYNILSAALQSTKCEAEMKSKIANETVLRTCKSDQDFFDFIKYVSTSRVNKCKLPTSVSKTVRKFYLNKTAVDLAKSYAKYKSYHCWSHKDLIKLGHVKSDTPLKNKIVAHILFKKSEFLDFDDETREVSNILTKSAILKKTTDPKIAVRIIPELRATIHQVEPNLRKSAEVWNAVLPNMSLSDVLRSLPKLYKLGFLKKDSPTLAIINELVLNPDKVKASRIHPVEVFVHMKNFEKGGKPHDPKLLDHLANEKKLPSEEIKKMKTPIEVKCPQLISNLQKCMALACSNVSPAGKRYMVTIDVTDKMDTPCLGNKNITSLEAAIAFTLTLLRVEKEVAVAVYNDSDVSMIYLDKNEQFNEHVQKLKEMKSKYLIPATSIERARAMQKNRIDIFINFIHHKEYIASVPKEKREKMMRPADALQRYRTKLNLPNTKLVTLCMSSPHINFADGTRNILDIVGLDMGVPKVLDAFCKGYFC